MFSLGNLNGKPIDLLLCTLYSILYTKLSLSWVVIGRSNTPYYGKKEEEKSFFWWLVMGACNKGKVSGVAPLNG
jgi:hypothetical protein